MHPHQTSVAKWMAIVIAERPFGCGANVGKDEVRGGFGGDSLKIDAIPGRCRRCEYAWLRTKLRVCVVPNSKAIAYTLIINICLLSRGAFD
jgi:hypothetical protein